jgi:hypothetical protein
MSQFGGVARGRNWGRRRGQEATYGCGGGVEGWRGAGQGAERWAGGFVEGCSLRRVPVVFSLLLGFFAVAASDEIDGCGVVVDGWS